MRGYRGFFREIGRTGTWRALRMQVATGAVHVLRQLGGRTVEGDPVARFFGHYREDGVAPADAAGTALADQAEACLVCGLCSFECARIGGAPPLDPRDAVVAAARLEVDWRRLGVAPGRPGTATPAGSASEPAGVPGALPDPAAAAPEGDFADVCQGCDACARVCPVGIPVHQVQSRLARIGAEEHSTRGGA